MTRRGRFPSLDSLDRIADLVPDPRVGRDLRDGLPPVLARERARLARNAAAIGAGQRARQRLTRHVVPALADAEAALAQVVPDTPLEYELQVLRWLQRRVGLFTAARPRPGRPPTLPEAEAVAYFVAQVLAVHGHPIGSGRRGGLAQVVEVLFDELGRGPEDLVTLLRRVVPRAREYAAWARRQPGAHRRTLGAVNPIPDAE